MLLSTISKFNTVAALDLGISRDNFEDISERLKRGINGGCNIIITSGGVSMGEADLMEKVLKTIGAKVVFGRMMMKPGKPTTFAVLEDNGKGQSVLIFSLPGNPVSCHVCSQLLVEPAIRKLSCLMPDYIEHPKVQAMLTSDIKLDTERPEFHRAIVCYNSSLSQFTATSTGVQRSSRLMSTVKDGKNANALLMLPKGREVEGGILKAGEVVDCLLVSPPTAEVEKEEVVRDGNAVMQENLATKKAALIVHLGGAEFDAGKANVLRELENTIGRSLQHFKIETTRCPTVEACLEAIRDTSSAPFELVIILANFKAPVDVSVGIDPCTDLRSVLEKQSSNLDAFLSMQATMSLGGLLGSTMQIASGSKGAHFMLCLDFGGVGEQSVADVGWEKVEHFFHHVREVIARPVSQINSASKI